MNIKPLFDNVVLKPVSSSHTSSIILPDTTEKPDIAVVYAIGCGGIIDGSKIEFQVKINDKVLFNKYASSEFEIENEKFFLIKQTDILAVLEK